MKKSELSNAHILAEVGTLPSSVNSYYKQLSFSCIFSAMVFAFLCFVGDLVFQMTPKYSV